MLKNIKYSIFAVAAVMLMTTNASAESKDFGQIYTECGLGGIIGSAINDRETSKIAAIVTNITWDLGTTASTSASTDACSNKKVRVANYINQSFEKLEKELAQGEGKYLDALASLVLEGKSSSSEYNTKLRTEFSAVVAEKGYNQLTRLEKVEKLYSIAL